MVDESIARVISKYLNLLRQQNIPIAYGVVFGSQVKGEAVQWSDIDLLVVSPRFDENLSRADINLLWRLAARTDSRLEPIPVGQQRFISDDSSAIIEIDRREGQIIGEEHARVRVLIDPAQLASKNPPCLEGRLRTSAIRPYSLFRNLKIS